MKKGKKSRSRSSRFEDSKSSDSINKSHIEEISLEKSKVLFREPFVVLLRKFCDSYEEYSERLKSGWKHTAFIHPSVLEGCIPYTPYIIIRGQTNEALCEPVSMQCIKKKSEIFFPKCDMGFKHEESVTLHPYYKKIKHADNIDVSLEPLNLPVNEELANHILRILSNRFIHCGMMRPFVLFDATYRCTILNISSSSLEKHSETEKSYNQCDLKNESSTSDLSLNETNCRNTSLVAHLEREQSDLNLSFTTQMSSLSIKDDSGNRIKQSESQDFYKVTYKTKLNIVQSSNSSESKSGPFFSDVAGLNQQLHSIKEFCLRFFSKENYSKMWGALICVGPHGTGKTLVAEAICNEFNVHVEKIDWHAIYSRDNITDAKREIRTIFQNATARTPSIILMDGFNYLCPNGKRTDFHSQVSSIISDLVEGQNVSFYKWMHI
ncbi:ATPase family protein 2 homolog [Stegodyphus dumicola]|uniref:ATPase family protein 2 homolog n=1 Tax=Stegodyphus dumicola TaxID=202533 RepID=UPI0015AF91E6|nr:ATPase family protein 2 homolog [Stegodyphus dumicola]